MNKEVVQVLIISFKKRNDTTSTTVYKLSGLKEKQSHINIERVASRLSGDSISRISLYVSSSVFGMEFKALSIASSVMQSSSRFICKSAQRNRYIKPNVRDQDRIY